MSYLKQIFCDGSIAEYKEEKDLSCNHFERILTLDGKNPTKVSKGYLRSKVEFLAASGNSNLILKYIA